MMTDKCFFEKISENWIPSDSSTTEIGGDENWLDGEIIKKIFQRKNMKISLKENWRKCVFWWKKKIEPNFWSRMCVTEREKDKNIKKEKSFYEEN